MSAFAAPSEEWTRVHDPVPGKRRRSSRLRIDDSPIGRRLGPFRVCAEIGEGGMATVYLGRRMTEHGLPQYVALKCIRDTHVDDPLYLDMFMHEAAIASQIQHPNVCRVLDFASYEGLHVLALEYLPGETLRMIRDRVLDADYLLDPKWHTCLVARIVADAAEGLHAAHELRDREGNALGVVHRDVCPANVMVTWDGAVKVMDFGLARSKAQRHRTRTGLVKGKYAYIQPEVLRGKKADRRADVWSLGVVLWELLTGERLFDGSTDAETLHAVSNAPIPLPSTVNPTLPPRIDAIVERALSRDPNERFPTTRELGRALVQFMADEGRAVGLADLAEFMELLFPTGPVKTRHLLDVADRVDRGSEAIEVDLDHAPAARRSLRSILHRSRRPLLTAATFGVAALLAGGLALHASDGTTVMAEPTMEAPRVSDPERTPARGVPVPETPYVIQIEGKRDEPDEIVLRLRRVGHSR